MQTTFSMLANNNIRLMTYVFKPKDQNEFYLVGFSRFSFPFKINMQDHIQSV